jgi:uncharacterized protein YcbX
MWTMHIRRIGSSPLKGARHRSHESAEFALDGPVGDRVFAAVDLTRGVVLKTVQNPALLGCSARWEDGVLSIDIGGERHSAVPRPVGPRIELDYWGRPSALRVVEGPWAAPLSALLGREVVLARAEIPGAVVYGDAVSIATTGSLRRLADAAGHDVDARRFRSNLEIDTGDAEPHLEDGWAGRELAVGGVVLRVAEGIPRCAVIDLDPATGASGTRLLPSLAGYRLAAGAIPFGVYARVVRAGVISRGDAVRVSP